MSDIKMISHDNPYKDYDVLSIQESIRQLRTMISEEYAAANLYESLAEVINDEDVAVAIYNIADEERVHAGEFEELIEYIQDKYNIIGKTDDDLAEEGEDEVKETLESESESESSDPAIIAAEQIFKPTEYVIIEEPDFNIQTRFMS